MREFLPRKFVEQERRRVFLPDADFAKRVVARLKPVSRQAADVWEYIPDFARPIVAVTMAALFVIIGLQMMYPEMPDQGIVDAHLAEDSPPTDAWLYQDAEIPEGDDLLLEITLTEELP